MTSFEGKCKVKPKIDKEKNAAFSGTVNSLVRNHFYWVNDKYEGWQPAQYAGGKDGHYFWPIGMDYEYKLGRELTAVGDEITIPNDLNQVEQNKGETKE